MPTDFNIKKGLDIRLEGEADRIIKNAPKSKVYALVPTDFHRITPKIITKEGEKVKAGTAVYYAKENESVVFCSPVSGEVINIVRGERRKILEIHILPDEEQSYEQIKPIDLSQATTEDVKKMLLKGGCWPYIKQRPYDVIADPADTPKAIFVSGIKSAPLAPDLDYVLEGKEKEIQAALSALALMTNRVHVTVLKGKTSIFDGLSGIDLHHASGPHPVGNVSTQISKIDPINKGEKVWVVDTEDLVIIGHLLLTGQYKPEKNIAVTGSEVRNPQYINALEGAKIDDILTVAGLKSNKVRIIQGDVLSGVQTSVDGFLGLYTNQITVIPEGDDYNFLGWQLPQFDKYSLLRANMFSYLTPNKKYALDANMNGEHRPFVLSGQFEKVFPLDIYPMEFLKSCLAGDIDNMEALGVYEVAPEDFALTEFIDISKNDHQKIVRDALDMMMDEVG